MNAAKFTVHTLRLHELSFERNNRFLFQSISCKLSQGDVLQVRGANGSGKSTLLRILAGYIQVEKNALQWNDQCISEQLDTYQQKLHYLGHQNGIKTGLTVEENLRLNLALSSKNNFDEIQSASEKVGLNHLLKTPANLLSAGQSRRLALARFLLNPLQIWILDEPATALDTAGQDVLNHLLKAHQANGGILIIATHQNLTWVSDIKTIFLGGYDD